MKRLVVIVVMALSMPLLADSSDEPWIFAPFEVAGNAIAISATDTVVWYWDTPEYWPFVLERFQTYTVTKCDTTVTPTRTPGRIILDITCRDTTLTKVVWSAPIKEDLPKFAVDGFRVRKRYPSELWNRTWIPAEDSIKVNQYPQGNVRW